MKTKLFFAALFAALLLIMQVEAQEIFPDGDIEWYTMKKLPESPGFSYHNYGHYATGELITINELEYRSIYDDEENYLGAYRVENENKKVFFIGEGDTEECVVYDFGLEVGDAITLPGFSWVTPEPEFVCTEIGEIELFDGSIRRYLKLVCEYLPVGTAGYQEQVWIEGVGGNRCPILSQYWGMYDSSDGIFLLTCFFHNDVKVYASPYFGCTVVGVEELLNEEKSTLTISPNPVTGTSKISTTSNTYICDYQIINTLGVVCEKGTHISTSDITLDRSKFIPGIYLLTTRCCENEKQTAVKFIVK